MLRLISSDIQNDRAYFRGGSEIDAMNDVVARLYVRTVKRISYE